MLGCVYLILAVLLGREITRNFLPEQRMREKGITPLWVTFAASFGSGVLLMTWAVYIAAWLLSVYSEAEKPLFGANLMVMACSKENKRKGGICGVSGACSGGEQKYRKEIGKK